MTSLLGKIQFKQAEKKLLSTITQTYHYVKLLSILLIFSFSEMDFSELTSVVTASKPSICLLVRSSTAGSWTALRWSHAQWDELSAIADIITTRTDTWACMVIAVFQEKTKIQPLTDYHCGRVWSLALLQWRGGAVGLRGSAWEAEG